MSVDGKALTSQSKTNKKDCISDLHIHWIELNDLTNTAKVCTLESAVGLLGRQFPKLTNYTRMARRQFPKQVD